MTTSKKLMWLVVGCAAVALLAVIVANEMQDEGRGRREQARGGRKVQHQPQVPPARAPEKPPVLQVPAVVQQPVVVPAKPPAAGPPALYDQAAWEAWLAALPEADRRYAVRLKSRFFLLQKDASIEFKTDHKRILMQFEDIPTEAQERELATYGVERERYLDGYAYLTYVLRDTFDTVRSLPYVRGVGELQVADKVASNVYHGKYGDWARDPAGGVKVDVKFFDSVSLRQAQEALAALGLTPKEEFEFNQKLTLTVPSPEVALAVAAEDTVEYLDQTSPPPRVFNVNAAALAKVNQVTGSPLNLNGSGVIVGEWDGGNVFAHSDFGGRTQIGETAPSIDDHATHVCGTILGSGGGNAGAKGMATAATLFSFDFFGNVFSEMTNALAARQIVLSTNSWGLASELFGQYSSNSVNIDKVALPGAVTAPAPLTILFAAGNDRNGTDTFQLMGTFASAKNVIAVGALNDNGTMSSFSSFGPTTDGRIKPDVSANGVGLTSTLPNNTYASFSGTSMATPATTGSCALLIGLFRQRMGGVNPPPGYLKALLAQTAVDFGNAGPDYKFGYGSIDVKAAADLVVAGSDPNLKTLATGQCANGATVAFTVNVPTGAPELKATVTWIDPPGSASAALARVNDLDLEAVAPNGTTFFPFVGPGAANPNGPTTTGHNDGDTLEQIKVAAPAAGAWTIKVKGHVVPVGPQPFVLIVNPGIGAASLFSLSGTARDGAGAGIANVTVNLSGSAVASAVTSATGAYAFSNLAVGDYTLTPVKAGLAFQPAQRVVSVTNANVTAQDFTGLVATTTSFSKVLNPVLAIPDNVAAGVSSQVQVDQHVTISDLNVFVDLVHAFIGALKVSITSPAGTTVLLHNRTGSSGTAINTTYDTQTAPAQSLGAFVGQDAFGTWTLNVADVDDFGDTGSLRQWRVDVTGVVAGPVLAINPGNLAFAGQQDGANPNAQGLAVSNAGAGTLNWTATVSANAPWLSVNPAAGTGAANVSVTASLAGLGLGDFPGTITFTAPGATGSPLVVPVTLTVNPATATTKNFVKDEVPDRGIPDANTTGITSTLDVPDDIAIQDVNVGVQITHAAIGDLTVIVKSPAGNTVILHNKIGGLTKNLVTTYDTLTAPTQSLAAFNGQSSKGTWSLTVTDTKTKNTGTLNLWSLQITGGAAKPPAFTVSPSPLTFNGNFGQGALPPQTLTVANSGGGTLSWSVTKDVPWLALSPLAGTNSGTVTVTANTAGLPAGTQNGKITFTATGATNSPLVVNVTLNVADIPPVLAVNPTNLAFTTQLGQNPPSQTFTVTNGGGGSLTWAATHNTTFLTLSPTGGTLGAGTSQTVTATVAAGGVPVGLVNGAINVTSAEAGATSPKVVSVSLTVTQPPSLAVSPSLLAFAGGEKGTLQPAPQNVSISNAGGGTLSWSIVSNAPFVTVAPTSGTGNGTVSVTANTTSLNAGNFQAVLTVTAGGGADGSPKSVNVSVVASDVTAPSPILNLQSLATKIDGPQLPAPAVKATSTNDAVNAGPGRATDADLTTGWQSLLRKQLTPESLTCDCGSTKNVGMVKLAARTNFTTSFPIDFQLQTSQDDVNYVSQVTVTKQVAGNGELKVYPFPAPVAARFVRVLVTKMQKSGLFFSTQIGEIQVLEPPPALNSGVKLTWTAVGDDGLTGAAAAYDLRQATAPISEGSFAAATPVQGVPAPQPSGSAETFLVTSLPAGQTFHFAIKAVDEAGNAGPLAGTFATTSADTAAPEPITELAAREVSGTGEALAARVTEASSVLGSGWEKELAADARPGTSWSSAGSRGPRTEHLVVDLGSICAVGSVRALPRSETPELFPRNVFVEVSLDGKSWKTVVRDQEPSRAPGEAAEFSFAAEAARYVRFGGTSAQEGLTQNHYAQVAELTVHEPKGPADRLVALSWKAPAAGTGTPEAYDVRFGPAPLDDATWTGATQAVGEGRPGAAGTAERFLLAGLTPGQAVELGVRVVDEAGNSSRLVKVAFTAGKHGDADTEAPAAVADLRAEAVTGSGQFSAALATAASSEQSAEYGKDKVTDGLYSTAWSTGTKTGPSDEFVTLDLGTTRPVNRVRAMPREQFASLFPADFRLETSVDGARWVVVKKVEGFQASERTHAVFEFPATPARFVRLVVTRMNGVDGLAYAQIAELEVGEADGPVNTMLRVRWTAGGDDGRAGRASAYDLRYATSPITDASWVSARPVTTTVPRASGQAEETVATGLEPGTLYYFALKVRDEAGNESALSNVGSESTGK
ncbi:MAG: discoidin domain-containing protein [Planctomycetes bacterium]|nr:discoidin domain-containing protein [Planctomycetota bacterium]